MRSFFAKVEFTDAKGKHPAGTVVNLPYDTDEDIANAQSMLRYGIVTEQAPPESLRPNEENAVVVQAEADVAPVTLVANDENPTTPEGEPVAEEAEQEQVFPTPDDPQTPEWDARNEDGSFASKEDVEAAHAPAEEEQSPVNEEPASEEAPAPAPKKRAQRRR